MKLRLVLVLGFSALGVLRAQNLPIGGHFIPGTTGLNATAEVPRGFYVRDFNLFYRADQVAGLPLAVQAVFFGQAPRFIWVSPGKFAGATWVAHVTVPLIYKELKTPLGSEHQAGLGDIQIEPLLLLWHRPNVSVGAGYALFAPSGRFTAATALRRLTSPGKGFWSHMFVLGGDWRCGNGNAWVFSLTGHFEVAGTQAQTHVTPGNNLTIEGGISRRIRPGLDAGILFYDQRQTTADSGLHAAPGRACVSGLGPEIRFVWPSRRVALSFSFATEFGARAHTKGRFVLLSLTRRF
ncbi:MAG TPA: transporter [Lacunisphaera sp.]|nr:transporter [Lacunisphaera sp.]